MTSVIHMLNIVAFVFCFLYIFIGEWERGGSTMFFLFLLTIFFACNVWVLI